MTARPYSKVWAEAGRFAGSGAARTAGAGAHTVSTAAAVVLRPIAFLHANMRAPAALFLLGPAQNTAAARRLPNFSGVLVLMLVGGHQLMPTTAHCLERMSAAGAGGGDDKGGKGTGSGGGRGNEARVGEGPGTITPVGRHSAAFSWVDALPSSWGAAIENTMTVEPTQISPATSSTHTLNPRFPI